MGGEEEGALAYQTERELFWFHSVLAGMGNRFFFDARGFFSRVSANIFFLVFFLRFLVFLLFFGGVFCVFWCFFVFRALARNFFWVFFRRRHEQNREFPLWSCGVRELETSNTPPPLEWKFADGARRSPI